jgi:hypothetical protein
MLLPARSEAELTDLFRRLGAPDPEGWAHSEVSEGIPQLLRYLVLRGVWKTIVGEDSTTWIETALRLTEQQPDAPTAGVGAALARMLAAGVHRDDLTALVRGMQYETAFSILYLLEDPLMAWDDKRRELRAELEPVTWSVVGEVGDGRVQDVGSLHEDLLMLDPTGREMRPSPPKQ